MSVDQAVMLVSVSGSISAICFTLATIAIWGIERRYLQSDQTSAEQQPHSFLSAMREVWQEPEARRMTVFVFISMFAFSAQELLLEPFAGAVFGLTLGETGWSRRVSSYGGVMPDERRASFRAISRTLARAFVSCSRSELPGPIRPRFS